ncbi:MAG TPA: carboxypeptidase regulatory-like domain-containing protein [Anaeromyxobacteraceae bacterium]|nr:carboxypeptidase regulatory-like domain-containing protein [Anaeromyxobacteraceae bacterium]
MARRRAGALAIALALLAAVASLFLWMICRDASSAAGGAASGAAAASGADEPQDEQRPGAPWRALEPAVPVRVPAAPAQIDRGSPGSFEGVVVSAASGQGIAGAELTFSSSGEAVTVVAGPGGEFAFSPRAAGRWTLAVVTAPGHFPFAPEWGHSAVLLDARPGAQVRGIVVTLQPAEEYRAIVVDRDRKPLAGIPVRILGAAAGETALVPLRERYVSGPDGRFAFVAPREAVLEATRDGYAPARATVDFAAWVSRSVELRFEDPSSDDVSLASISGRVELSDGQSAGGALVTVWPRRRGAEEPPRDATADSDGRFAVAGLQPGRYRVRASYPGVAPGRVDVEAGANDVVVRLERGGRLSGVVRTASGEPVHPFTVAVRARRQRWGEPLQTLSVVDPAGRFDLDGLPSGPASVVVAAPGRAPSAPIAVTIPEPGAEPARIEVVLSAGGTVQGRVRTRGSGAPIAEAEIAVEGQLDVGASALPVRSLARTDAEGRFSISGLPDRPLSLLVAARDHHGRVLSGVHVREGETAGPVDVELSRVAPGDEPSVELVGIGAVLTMGDDGFRIARVVPGGGAAEVGLLPGDDIVRIDGRPAGELDLEGAVQLIRGPENSTITLGVRRRGRDDAAGPERSIVVPRRVVRG